MSSISLTGAMQSAASALDTFSKTVQVAAHNIANISTDGFKPLRADLADGPKGNGTRISALSRDGTILGPGDNSQGAPLVGRPSATDLAREIPGLVISERSFQANTKTITTVDEMLGTILNIKG